jgi:hypothetical protein
MNTMRKVWQLIGILLWGIDSFFLMRGLFNNSAFLNTIPESSHAYLITFIPAVFLICMLSVLKNATEGSFFEYCITISAYTLIASSSYFWNYFSQIGRTTSASLILGLALIPLALLAWHSYRKSKTLALPLFVHLLIRALLTFIIVR